MLIFGVIQLFPSSLFPFAQSKKFSPCSAALRFGCKSCEQPRPLSDCWVALVQLDEYFKLIAEDGQMREYLFESNVRDYEGDVEVNKQIRSTLENPKGADFWWLNNGITIVAESVTGHPQELVIDDPQIVNGLQTSQVIFECLRQPPLPTGQIQPRHVVIRIIKSTDEELSDRIIRATNSQTKIPAQYRR
jgi:hypothetical protein